MISGGEHSVMIRFEYHEPHSLDETIALLQRYGDDARLLAGGTDLIIAMERRLVRPGHVISLLEVPGLDRFGPDDGMTIGALVTHRRLERASWLRGPAIALAEAAHAIGGHQVRNIATVGGNICNASPAADTVPPLLCLDAEVRLVGPDGERLVPLDRFFTGPGQTVRTTAEVLTEIRVPPVPPRTATSFFKVGRRKAMELSIVCVAARISLAEDGQTCANVRIALGAVAPTPIRARRAEAILHGEKLTPGAIREAAQMAITEARPIDDVRASAEYRRMLIGTLVERAIARCLDRISGP
jgi:carbon-monoxide dehydrogenase medium subunit